MRFLHRKFRKALAVVVAAGAAALGLAAVAAPPAAASTSCSAAYSVQTDWGSGFTAQLAVTNNGTSAITGWTVTYSYSGNQTLQSGWSGNWTQSGENVTVTNASWNGSLAAGASATGIGANFNYSGTNTAPASVTCTPAGGTTTQGTITPSVTQLSVAQGHTGTFTLALSQAPTSNVTVSIASSGNTGLTASPTSLTFTPSNYSTPQTVTVTGNATGTGTTTFTASASGYTSATVTATETPVSTASITATPTSLSVTQGSTGTFTLALSSAPTSNVTVSVAASGNTGLTASPTSLTFTPSNYSTPQTVTVTANSSGTGTTTFTASAAGYTGATVTATENPVVTSGAAPQLQVSGNKLVNSSGQTVVLHGVDRSGTEYSCVQGTGIFDGPNDQASITAMKSWGPVNAVRVPLNEACWNGESYVNSAYAGTNYINAIKAYVSLLNSNGIVAILDLHWTDGTYTGPGAGSCTSANQAEAFCQKPMPDAAQSVPFWTSVANTFKGNDAVIFDLFNEPFPEQADSTNETEGWQCWLNGGSSCVGLSYTAAGMQTLVNAVRSTGANNVLMLGGLEWSNDLTQWLQHEPTDPDHDLAASWHSYNFNACSSQSCWTSQVAPVAASVPVVAGEIGENDCAGSYIDPLTTWLESENISFLAWAWNADFACSSGPGLITDYTGTPTAYGAAYKAILQALPASSASTLSVQTRKTA
jgi:endoglucanase